MANHILSSMRGIILKGTSLLPIALLAALTLSGVSCSSTKVLSFSNSHPEAKQPVTSVVTVMIDDRSYLRAAVENIMVGRFKELGIEAYASHTKVSINDVENDKDKARKEISEWGTDAVLISKLTDRTDISEPAEFVSNESHWEQTWSAPTASTTFDPNPWGGEVVVTVHVESKLYRLSTSELLWAGYTRTEMKEFTDDMKMIRAVSRKIVNQIKKDGWIK